MPFPDGTLTLLEEGELLCKRLKGRTGHRVVFGLVERVKDLEFQIMAMLALAAKPQARIYKEDRF